MKASREECSRHWGINLVTVLTSYVSQISACKVHGEPSRDRYTINIVSLLPLWENICYGSAVFHLYIWKADTSVILRQPNIAQQRRRGWASIRNKLISKITGIWKKAWEAALSNDCWSLAWNSEIIVSLLEESKAWNYIDPKRYAHKVKISRD